MGLIIHHSFIVTDYNDGNINDAHKKALDLGFQVSDIITSETNGYHSFFVSPDGSKEFWETSDEFNLMRDEYIKFLESNVSNWVLVEYGETSARLIGSHYWED